MAGRSVLVTGDALNLLAHGLAYEHAASVIGAAFVVDAGYTIR